jgi:hypothetical protein
LTKASCALSFSRDARDLHADDLPRAVALDVDVDVPVVARERLALVRAGHARAPAKERHVAVQPDVEVLDRVRVDAQVGRHDVRHERRLGLDVAGAVDLAKVLRHVVFDGAPVLAHDGLVPCVGLGCKNRNDRGGMGWLRVRHGSARLQGRECNDGDRRHAVRYGHVAGS